MSRDIDVVAEHPRGIPFLLFTRDIKIACYQVICLMYSPHSSNVCLVQIDLYHVRLIISLH